MNKELDSPCVVEESDHVPCLHLSYGLGVYHGMVAYLKEGDLQQRRYYNSIIVMVTDQEVDGDGASCMDWEEDMALEDS